MDGGSAWLYSCSIAGVLMLFEYFEHSKQTIGVRHRVVLQSVSSYTGGRTLNRNGFSLPNLRFDGNDHSVFIFQPGRSMEVCYLR